MADRTHLLTVAVEDYFDATVLSPLVSTRQKERLEPRVVENTRRVLEILKRYDQKATFFVLGRTAAKHPELVQAIFNEGHEVACKGFEHRPLAEFTRESFERDALRAKSAVESALGRRTLGFRVAEGSLGPNQLWMLGILTKLGFEYDSSVYPRALMRSKYRFPFEHKSEFGSIREFPLSTFGAAGLVVPLAGGNYFRQLPKGVPQAAFEFWHRRYSSPFNMYFHVWEVDEELPTVATARGLAKLRQYRNLDRMPSILESFFQKYRFTSIAAFSRLEQEPLAEGLAPPPPGRTIPRIAARQDGAIEDLTIVVPMFNESKVLGYLESALAELSQAFGIRYDVRFILVDDCSTDDSWERLQERFGHRSEFQLIRHDANRGVAGAIMTGIRAATTELVCSMDSDCTYDPLQLRDLLEQLTPDVAMVTASPYHKAGKVMGVPEWRLFLSRNLSRLYGRLLHHKFATYTACFRAYRKSRVEHISLEDTGFLGVAELLVRLDVEGESLAECPATLEVRLLGVSKLKTARTIQQHLKLLSSIPKLKRELRRNQRP